MNLKRLSINYLNSSHIFTIEESLLKFKFRFFNSMLLLAIIVPPFAAILHSKISTFLIFSDLSFSISSIFILFYLRIKKTNFRLASLIFIPSLYITITIAFFLAGDDPSKISWSPILFACAFLLLGSRAGMFWLLATLASYLVGYFTLGENGIFFSLEEIILVSLAFITVSLIFDAFKKQNEEDTKALKKANMMLVEKRSELEIANKNLQKNIQRSLQENQNKTISIQQHLNIINKQIMTVNIDLNGLITNISEAYCSTTGYKKHYFLAKPFTILFNINTPILELKNIWQNMQEEKEYLSEIKNEASNHKQYWIDLHLSPEYTVTKEHIGYIGIATNITDKKLVLQQQKQLISQSRHAAMGEMISMIAHQWRQPLSTISAISTNVSLDIELNKQTSDSLEEQMQSIQNQVSHLSSTVEDFRNFFKPSKGLENSVINELVDEAIKLLEYRLKFINIKQVGISKTCLALYHNELVQVIINIFNNSCDAIEQNKIKNPIITINEYREEPYVVIEISDNAGGIDKKILNLIFDPYFSTKDKNGTGLGLYMSKTIIEDHQKGILDVFNTKEGVTFKISLPIHTCNI